MIHAVVFDMDGVLLDTEKYLVKYWCQAAGEFGFPMQREHALRIRSLAGCYAEPLLKELLGKGFDYEKVRMRRKELMEAELAKNGVPMKPEVEELLEYLQDKGIKRAVATATDEERAGRYLREIGIYDKFDKIVCAPMVKRGKPMPDIYLYACEQIGESPENCLAVEDSPNGVRSAFSAGLQVVMVPDLTQPDEACKELLAGQAESLGQIVEFLEQYR